jgi:hypothetical protein
MKVVKDEFGAMVAWELTPRIIDARLTEHSDWAPATKNRYRALISLVYRQAMRHGKAEKNPARLVAARTENNGRIHICFPMKRRHFAGHAEALSVPSASASRSDQHWNASVEQFSLTWDSGTFGDEPNRVHELASCAMRLSSSSPLS